MSQAAIRAKQTPPVKTGTGRTNGHRLAGILFLVLVLLALLLTSYLVIDWMRDPERLPLSKLVVTGERHYTSDDDMRLTILAMGEPGTFMTQDVNVIQTQVLRLPWIKQASVRKQWPDKLKIHLLEYVPIARWNGQELMDKEGFVFSVPADRASKENYPQLFGPEGSEKEVMHAFSEMADVLNGKDLVLHKAVMSSRRSWQLVLDSGIRLELGRNEPSVRLQRFIDLYPLFVKQTPAGKQIDYVDLRYDSGASVGWKNVK